MKASIRRILSEQAALRRPIEQLADDADLYDAGLKSFAAVQLMLALEEAFGVEFPQAFLSRRTFASVDAIAAAVAALRPSRAVG